MRLGGHVIRVFRTRYPMDYIPDINNIVKDEVLFYAHTMVNVGAKLNAWTKIGKPRPLILPEIKSELFGFCLEFSEKRDWLGNVTDVIKVDPLKNWTIWHIGKGNRERKVRSLSPQQKEILTDGSILPYTAILDRIKYGYYKHTDPMYDVIKRRPLPDVDSYCRREVDGVTIYYHFHGADLVREMFVDGETVYRLSEQEPISPRYSLDAIKFWDINWDCDDFIPEEEFNHAWSDK